MSLLEARRTRDEIKIRVRSGQAAVDMSHLTFRGDSAGVVYKVPVRESTKIC